MAELIELNVGGCLYTTTKWTLTRDPNSWLGRMFSVPDNIPVRVNGAYFINGDGPIFRHVLNFLRRGRLILPEDFKEWDLLATEANHYQVGALVEAVKKEKYQRVIEISAIPNVSYTYTGSSSILEKIPSLVDFFKPYQSAPPQVITGGQVTLTVKPAGGKPHSTAETLHRRFEHNLVAIIQEIERLGFQAEKETCTMNNSRQQEELRLTFFRRIGG
ncbi:BTB/POZ domain-containing protein KCTD6-like [Patiria miniata]|uniref:BTB domain-containing protein n=1 Tax=Patiria miniata TaxID=46514 RepID=A0A913ZJ38_PATMI|nr:BTB/POZ domain-containing protein KCTD6-like [Patiria miniata]XP_038052321.1 BTB/POZ domain-containing protein KCTD6-like [Patiria miniata]